MNRDGALFTSITQHWATPRSLYEELNAEFNFDWDPCPLGADSGGLIFEGWVGKRAFCNPPYGPNIGLWLKRGLLAKCAVFLIPARTKMNSDLECAMRNWTREVDDEAVRLIEQGVPPYEAIDQAKENVSNRRRQKAGLCPKRYAVTQ